MNLTDLCNPKQWKTVSTSDLKGAGYPVYGANGIIGYYDKYNHEEPTILITCRGATCGEIHICQPKSYVNGNAMALDNLSEEINIKYLYYYLLVFDFKNIITGSAQPQITKQGLKKLKVKYPQLEIQKKIVELLDKVQELIAARNEQIRLMDELIHSVFYEMFGDPLANPKGWEVGIIDDLTKKTQFGISKKGNKSKGEYPIIQKNNITYSGGWDFTSLKYIDLDEQEREKYLVHNGELLFNRTNNKEMVGKTAVFREIEPMAYEGNLVKLKVNSKCNPEYLSAFLNSAYGKVTLSNMTKGIVGIANINVEELKSIRILLPPVMKQNEFATLVVNIEHEKHKLNEALGTLKIIFNSIIQRAFRGTLFSEEI